MIYVKSAFRINILMYLIISSVHVCWGQCQTLPSPSILIKSWQQQQTDLKAHITSYYLDGDSKLLDIDGKPLNDNSQALSWHAINANQRFKWWFQDNLGLHQIASQGDTYDAYGEGGTSTDNYLIHNSNTKFPIQKYLNYFLATKVPFTLNTLIDYPTAVCTPNAMSIGIPFPQYYQTLSPKLKTIGLDVIDGYKCFHIQMPFDPQSNMAFLPQDIWFAVIDNHFVPIQYYLYNKKGTFRTVITITKFQSIAGTNIPVAYKTSMDIRETSPSGKSDWEAHPVSRYQEVTIKVSKINQPVQTSLFTISPNPGRNLKEFKDETTINRQERVQKKSNNVIKFIFVLWFLIGLGYIIWIYRRTKR